MRDALTRLVFLALLVGLVAVGLWACLGTPS